MCMWRGRAHRGQRCAPLSTLHPSQHLACGGMLAPARHACARPARLRHRRRRPAHACSQDAFITRLVAALRTPPSHAPQRLAQALRNLRQLQGLVSQLAPPRAPEERAVVSEVDIAYMNDLVAKLASAAAMPVGPPPPPAVARAVPAPVGPAPAAAASATEQQQEPGSGAALGNGRQGARSPAAQPEQQAQQQQEKQQQEQQQEQQPAVAAAVKGEGGPADAPAAMDVDAT